MDEKPPYLKNDKQNTYETNCPYSKIKSDTINVA